MPLRKHNNARKHPIFNLGLNDLPGEKWKDLPGCFDRYVISNWGRVKTLPRLIDRPLKGPLPVSERILKPKIVEQSFMTGAHRPFQLVVQSVIDSNRKKYTFAIARIVYNLFVKNFDTENPNLFIGYKDNDPLNLNYKNLKLITRSTSQRTSYRNPRRWRPSKAISQYSHKGDLIRTYNSMVDAARVTNSAPSHIWKALNGQQGHCKGFIWKYGKREKIKAVKFPVRGAKRVAQYTLKNQLVKNYNSVLEACRMNNFDDIGIRDTAKKKRRSYKGYIWRYID